MLLQHRSKRQIPYFGFSNYKYSRAKTKYYRLSSHSISEAHKFKISQSQIRNGRLVVSDRIAESYLVLAVKNVHHFLSNMYFLIITHFYIYNDM